MYVRVTDGDGKVYEQNRSIKCYDTEKPTLSASLTDGVLTIQGNDTVSGITAVTVNGTTYTDLKDGMLRVQLTQKDFTTKQIEITVTDGAGNTSESMCCRILIMNGQRSRQRNRKPPVTAMVQWQLRPVQMQRELKNNDFSASAGCTSF